MPLPGTAQAPNVIGTARRSMRPTRPDRVSPSGRAAASPRRNTSLGASHRIVTEAAAAPHPQAPSSVGMDGVRVIVRDGEGRCASAAADVHIKAAASSSLTVSHEGDVFMELLEDSTGTLPPLQIGGPGALNVSVEASCGGIFELEAGDDYRIWARGAALGFEASNSKAAAAALARVAFTPPHNFYGGWGAETFEDARSDAIKRFCRSLREDPPLFILKVRSSGDAAWTSKTLRVNVLPRNDAPILTVDGAATAVAADADGAAPWSRVGAGISVSDADAGLLDVRVSSKAGALRLSAAATGVEVLATPSTEVSLRGPPRAVERALRAALEFRPAAPGVSTLNVTARDGGGCGAGDEGVAAAQLSVRAATLRERDPRNAIRRHGATGGARHERARGPRRGPGQVPGATRQVPFGC